MSILGASERSNQSLQPTAGRSNNELSNDFKIKLRNKARSRQRWLSLVSLDLVRFSALYVFVLAAALHAYAEPKALPSEDILLAISSAHEAYVFPYTFSGEHPQVDRKHLRPLDAAARDTLKRLLDDRRNWYVGLLTRHCFIHLSVSADLTRSRSASICLISYDVDIFSSDTSTRALAVGKVASHINSAHGDVCLS